MKSDKLQISINNSNFKTLLIIMSIVITLLLSNISAIIDLFIHPEYPYFYDSHVIVGIISGIFSLFFFALIFRYINKIKKTSNERNELLKELNIAKEKIEQSAEKIRFSYLYTRSLMEANIDSLMVIDIDGKITDVNLATENLTGLSRDSLIGSDFLNCFTEPDKAKIGYQKVLENDFVIDYPLTIQNKSGKVTDVLYNATIFRDEHDKTLGILADARDITERKQAELIINQQNKDLKKLNTDKDQFITILAHDLKSPFNSILGFLDLLTKNIRKYDIDKIEKQINIVNNSAKNTFKLLVA